MFSLGKNPYLGVDHFFLIRYLERGERLDKPLNAACSQEMWGDEQFTYCRDTMVSKILSFVQRSSLFLGSNNTLEYSVGLKQVSFVERKSL